MTNEENLSRAKAIMATWPQWKRDYKLTKYSKGCES